MLNHGVTPAKSLKETVPVGMEKSNHFWRGMIDGDGHLKVGHGSYGVLLCGSYEVCSKFSEYCKSLGILTVRVKESTKTLGFYTADFSGIDNSKYLLDTLYKGADESIRLSRKYNTYLSRYKDKVAYKM